MRGLRWPGVWVLVSLLVVGGFWLMDEISLVEASEESQLEEKDHSGVQDAPLKIEVVLERVYIDGHTTEETVQETIWAMEDFWARYDGWQVLDQREGHITFQKHMDDLSPLIKEVGYFGLNEGNELILFDGTKKSPKVIQSFFQIDVGKLESFQNQELKQGIKIKSKDHYISLLKQFEYLSITP